MQPIVLVYVQNPSTYQQYARHGPKANESPQPPCSHPWHNNNELSTSTDSYLDPIQTTKSLAPWKFNDQVNLTGYLKAHLDNSLLLVLSFDAVLANNSRPYVPGSQCRK
jgi:hypothetical protein